jgi:hypothetical protein
MVATVKMLRKCLLVRDRPGNHPILLGKTYVTNSNWKRRRRRRYFTRHPITGLNFNKSIATSSIHGLLINEITSSIHSLIAPASLDRASYV